MKILTANYEENLPKINFLERKKKIQSKNTIIIGGYGVGKSYLIFDFLSNFNKNEILYIDFLDLRNLNIEEELHLLQEFIVKNSILVLVLDNFSLPYSPINCENIVISTNKNINIDGFSKIYLNNLDFEEYLLFDNKQLNITSSFNSFLKYGNSAKTIFIEDSKKIQVLQDMIKSRVLDKSNLMIFLTLLENIDEKKSFFQLFSNLKTKIKISKDRFYEVCKDFEEQNLIFFIEKFNQKNSPKKIYSYNHALLSTLTFQKKFKQEFANMVFLELNNKFKEIYYLDLIDFYTPQNQTITLCIPFFSEQSNQNLIKKIVKISEDLDINNIEIITVSNSNKIKNNSVQIEVFSFFEWSLR